MNEITAAIKKAIADKAEARYELLTPSQQEDAEKRALFNYDQMIRAEAYTCGGEDAIGFMLKFVEWVACNYVPVIAMKELKYWQKENYQNKERFYSTEELLKIFMEDNKL